LTCLLTVQPDYKLVDSA